ncbi:quinone-dependent dihydroorotate dehydrogenase [Candidatus Microgenomates bacterium]|nr:quinone-dependent dihydroorotate dehydrogenase [Candidatus Microgenomates bacterium]
MTYQEIIRPLLIRLDSETWHDYARETLHLAEKSSFTLKVLELLLAYHHRRYTHEKLHIVLGGVSFDNPLMVGAGWDKAGRAVKSLYTLGFSGVEVGSVLAFQQPGNPKPRQFIIGPGVALNHLGFNSPGVKQVAANLAKYENNGIPIGVNIGKNRNTPDRQAPAEYAVVAGVLYQYADYFVINVSSPNTPGLRRLQDREPLTDIVQAVNSKMIELGGPKPLFVKIAPDLTEEAANDVIRVVADHNLSGIVATNTTIDVRIKAKYGNKWRNREGGLSGDDPDFREMATTKISHIWRETKGQIEIIGVGGVKDAVTALEKIKSGAKVIQIVTGLVGEGPALPGKINRELVAHMNKRGIKSINDLVGSRFSNKTTV